MPFTLYVYGNNSSLFLQNKIKSIVNVKLIFTILNGIILPHLPGYHKVLKI